MAGYDLMTGPTASLGCAFLNRVMAEDRTACREIPTPTILSPHPEQSCTEPPHRHLETTMAVEQQNVAPPAELFDGPRRTRRPTVRGRRYAIAAGHHLAALAGQRILDRGG